MYYRTVLVYSSHATKRKSLIEVMLRVPPIDARDLAPDVEHATAHKRPCRDLGLPGGRPHHEGQNEAHHDRLDEHRPGALCHFYHVGKIF